MPLRRQMTSLSLVSCHRQLSRLLVLVGLLSVALVTLTPLGFPYSSDRPHIRAQRIWVQVRVRGSRYR